jgi:sugar phosphate isomerase/epimerase
MRLGVAEGPLPFDPALVDERVAAKIAELGFSGVTAHLGYGSGAGPDEVPAAEWARVREALASYGVRVAWSWSWDANLVAGPSDWPAQRQRLHGALRVAAALGADGIVIGAGGHHPRGPDWPHRENHAPATRERLVDNLRDAAGLAADLGVTMALEGHVATTLSSPERMLEIVEAVGSPAVRVNMDPVNVVGDLPTLWDTTDVVERCFALLGPYVVSGHVKDVYAEERLVVHLSQCVPGDGELDLHAYLRRFEEVAPDAYVFVEHLPEELVPRAKQHVDRVLAELGIVPRGAIVL